MIATGDIAALAVIAGFGAALVGALLLAMRRIRKDWTPWLPAAAFFAVAALSNTAVESTATRQFMWVIIAFAAMISAGLLFGGAVIGMVRGRRKA